ncbi:transcription factor bHLH112-like isoform X2 [Humulus lupulus]|uniref:transcription factor bHLH112-like isoform X2 n=1 Tax=Humulus lupulus TaxID=3486 RepID=UPI002B417921|nr:transcription factor bHLH112-like isoform X2 [Humulus lupulus]
MAEEFQIQGGICGGANWWNPSRSVFSAAALPCSMGSFGWPNNINHDLLDIKMTRSSSSSGEETTAHDHSCNNIFQDQVVDHHDHDHDHDHDQDQKSLHHLQTHNHISSVSGAGTGILIDSTSLQMMGYGLSTSPTSDFTTNQPFVSRSSSNGRAERNNNFYSMLQQDHMASTKLNYRQEICSLDENDSSSQIQKDCWTSCTTTTTTSPPPKGFSSAGDDIMDSSATCTATSQALSAGFPVASSPFEYTSAALLQNLFEGETTSSTAAAANQLPVHEQSFGNSINQLSVNINNNYSASSVDANNNSYMSSTNNIWPRFSPLIPSSRPSVPLLKHQLAAAAAVPPPGLHFSNNTPFWNASSPVAGPNDGVFPNSTQPQQLRYVTPKFEEKPSKCNNYVTKVNSNIEDVHHDSAGSISKKSSNSTTGNDQPVVKRPRIETPSPLPTFKVRKEKLGDRITALQQLVSPFGKTDTASVLHEAIEYIKFLHDQVLSTPYMKNNGAAIQAHQQGSNKLQKNQDESSPKQDLKSRGLCLVPISSTFPVANETTADFWTPTSAFGGTFIR